MEVLYLSSSESAFVVGTELVVDGGMIQLRSQPAATRG